MSIPRTGCMLCHVIYSFSISNKKNLVHALSAPNTYCMMVLTICYEINWFDRKGKQPICWMEPWTIEHWLWPKLKASTQLTAKRKKPTDIMSCVPEWQWMTEFKWKNMKVHRLKTFRSLCGSNEITLRVKALIVVFFFWYCLPHFYWAIINCLSSQAWNVGVTTQNRQQKFYTMQIWGSPFA